MKKSSGYTLLELTLVMGIIIFLIVASIPHGVRAYHSLNISKTQHQLEYAIALSKSISQKNQYARNTQEAVSMVCLKEKTIFVTQPKKGTNAACNLNQSIWSYEHKPFFDIATSPSGQSFKPMKCLCYGTTGLFSDDTACSQCAKDFYFKLYSDQVDEIYPMS